jgi:CheY-like chemotaxis protein
MFMVDSSLAPRRYVGRYRGAVLPWNSLMHLGRATRLPENLHVVVVDDDPFFRSLLRLMLTQAGLPNPDVMEAEDSQGAIGICQNTPVDLVFCDLNLPAMRSKNGLEIIRDLRLIIPEAPLYMVTADRSEELIEKVLAVGATGHILKPVSLRALKRILMARFVANPESVCALPAVPEVGEP